jgi:hypothetical protein
MKFLGEVAGELFGMFVGDSRLALGVLAIVAAAALLAESTGFSPLVGGNVLLLGGPILLIENVRRSAARTREPVGGLPKHRR